MEIQRLLEENREEILQIAKRHGAKNIRLFGSVVRGEAGESSDIDILVEVGENPSPWFPGGLISDLEELLDGGSMLRSERCIRIFGTGYCERRFPYE